MNPRIDAIRGCVALARGPLVYCIEQADHPADVAVEDLRLDPAAPPEPAGAAPDLGVPVTLVGPATLRSGAAHELYPAHPAGATSTRACSGPIFC